MKYSFDRPDRDSSWETIYAHVSTTPRIRIGVGVWLCIHGIKRDGEKGYREKKRGIEQRDKFAKNGDVEITLSSPD